MSQLGQRRGERDSILCTEALRRARAWCIHIPARSLWPGWRSMRVVVGEVYMSQSRQALLYHKESEFYSRYNRTSWGYKARMVNICYNFGCPALTLLPTWNSLFYVLLMRECAQPHSMEDRASSVLCVQQPRHRQWLRLGSLDSPT